MAKKRKQIQWARDWAEYVYQSDMTEQLYAVTTAGFELLDILRLNPGIQIPPELQPVVDSIKKAIGDEFEQLVEDVDS